MTDDIKQKRDSLKAISRMVQQLVKAGVYPSVNAGLVDMYRQQGHTEIHSFKQWHDKGFFIKKGEKALLLWGEPRKAQKQEKNSDDDKDEFDFFPLAYVFSQMQVEPRWELAR